MEEILDEIDYSSNSDSIVMGVLRSAMDRAHEKVQCKDGPIGFLHERSKFYEVAAILVDAGLNIVQEETDILESNREKIRLDLMEIEHWLHGRIKQMKLLIVDKDKELKERIENEVKLRQALELKEKELVYLRSKKKLERSKSESFREFIAGEESLQDEAKEREYHGLIYSLDQQVCDIKQKLEDETKRDIDHLDPNELLEKEKYESIEFKNNEKFTGIDSIRPESVVIHQMSSDIDILKGTLDLAFGRMQKAEVLPLKKQWRWIIEKDIISISIRGFITELKKIVEAEFTKIANHTLASEAITRLDNLMNGRTIASEESKTEFERLDMNTSYIDRAAELKEEINNSKEEREHQDIQILIMEEIYLLLFQGFREDRDLELCQRIECFSDECLVKEEMFRIVFGETIKNTVLLSESQAPSQMKVSENICSATRSDVVDREESLIEKLDSLLRAYEVEEDLQEGIDTKEHEPYREKIDEVYTVESLLTDDESNFNSANEKLERALEQLHTSRGLLNELVYSVGTSADDLQKGALDNQIHASPEVESEREFAFCQVENSRAPQSQPPDPTIVVKPPVEFDQLLQNFEEMAHKKVELNCLRMQEMKQKLATLFSSIISIRDEKLLYKKAFLIRCHNLQLAEAEVDLLADQVDRLFNILEKVYVELDRNSTVLSRDFGVCDLLKLIKKELAFGVADTTES